MRYRLHYTLATGTPSKNLLVDQAKCAVTAESDDGLHWTDRRIILRPRLDAAYENAAVIALNPWKTASGWRAMYAGIGTRFGAYSICEAQSDDGLTWHRGKPGENLALAPSGYSGLWIARELKAAGHGKLITIEIGAGRSKQARENFRRAGLDDVVDARVGDARKLVREIKEPVDFLFIDCDYPNYRPWLTGIEDRLTDGAVVVVDNVGIGAGGHEGLPRPRAVQVPQQDRMV